jgi:hypothetical protein
MSNFDHDDRSIEAQVSDLAAATFRVAAAITPNICGGKDASEGHVESLTEAVMGITAGLFEVAGAIRELAEAVREQEHA